MVTINDVAKRAGVSRGTVSNVINHVKVRPEYKEKVEKAIEELGYIPNAYARSLKSNKTNTVAFILPTVWFPFFAELTNDIESNLRDRGYRMLLCNSHNDYRLELDYIKMAKENKVDGILAITYSDIAPYVSGDIPLVTMERYFSREIPFISTDNFKGGAMVASKLHDLGCRKLLFVGRLSNENGVTGLRRDGFVSWCRENGANWEELYSTKDSETFIKEIHAFVENNFKEGAAFDGIFAATDRYCDYIIDALEVCQCPVIPGKDIQLIGFDGAKSHEHDIIRISSMRQPVEEIAKIAVDTLCGLINGEEVEHFRLLPVSFVQGKTTRIPDADRHEA